MQLAQRGNGQLHLPCRIVLVAADADKRLPTACDARHEDDFAFAGRRRFVGWQDTFDGGRVWQPAYRLVDDAFWLAPTARQFLCQ